MSVTDLHTLAGVYALDALDDTELLEFEQHLLGCEQCQTDVSEMQSTAALLAISVAEPPPPELRGRVLDAVAAIERESSAAEAEPRAVDRTVVSLASRRRKVMTAVLAAAAAVVLVVAIATTVVRRTDPIDTAMSALLADPNTQVIPMSGPSGESGRVLWSASSGKAVVVADRLPAAKDDEVYELWFIDGGQPRPGANISGSPNAVAHEFAVTSPPPEQLAMTIERAPGASQPTSPIILSGTPPN